MTNGVRVYGEVFDRVAGLLYDYVQCLDDDRLEEWPAFFIEQGRYRIMSRENMAAGLPLCILDYTHAGMMRDRVLVLRKTAVYSKVYDCHVVSAPRAFRLDDGSFRLQSGFTVHKTDKIDGNSWLFVAGHYDDVVVETQEGLRFREKTAVIDTYSVPNHLGAPI